MSRLSPEAHRRVEEKSVDFKQAQEQPETKLTLAVKGNSALLWYDAFFSNQSKFHIKFEFDTPISFLNEDYIQSHGDLKLYRDFNHEI